MPNFLLPNPAQLDDKINAILASLSGTQITGPGLAVITNSTGSTSYTYEIVAKSNGVTVPGSTATLATGPSVLSSTAYNTLTWSMLQNNLPNLTFDIYRTASGGTPSSTGRISIGTAAASLSLNPTASTPVFTFVDTGIAGDGTTPPPFNTSGALVIGTAYPVQSFPSAGSVSLLNGLAVINGTSATAVTLPVPVAGSPNNGGNDGMLLTVLTTTLYAHTLVSATASKIFPNGTAGKTTGTFTNTTYANFAELVAFNGAWYVCASAGVSWS